MSVIEKMLRALMWMFAGACVVVTLFFAISTAFYYFGEVGEVAVAVASFIALLPVARHFV